MLKRRADIRQLLTVAVHFALLVCMYTIPACRNLVFLGLSCVTSFLTAVVNHNHLHQGIFRSKRANGVFRLLLSFSALYPVSANVPAHNLVHHSFDDGGQPDWADPQRVRFRWNLLNLLHFPNVVGPVTFAGVGRWKSLRGKAEFRRQYTRESIFAFGLTAALLAWDFWTALLFVVVPQLFGARWFLRINIIQHDGCDPSSKWNHSRNFVGRTFNFFMLNNGFHTIHHNRAGLHWTELPRAHDLEVAPQIDPRLEEPSFFSYLLRVYVLRTRRDGQAASESAWE